MLHINKLLTACSCYSVVARAWTGIILTDFFFFFKTASTVSTITTKHTSKVAFISKRGTRCPFCKKISKAGINEKLKAEESKQSKKAKSKPEKQPASSKKSDSDKMVKTIEEFFIPIAI